MMAPVNVAIENAGPDLSRLVESAQEGREVVLTRGGQPVAKIVSLAAGKARPKPGYAKGTVVYMAEDFDEPLPDFDVC